MWQENHLSRFDQVLNRVGCLFMIICLLVSFWLGLRDVTTYSKTKKT